MKKSKEYKQKNFFSSFGAAVHLSEIAKSENHYIELVCLFASIIDGVLRLTLVMKEQIDSNSDVINEKILFQDNSDNIITEKTIYQRALDKKIITKPIHQKLNRLYEKRNKIIHRYIISDLKTLGVQKTAIEYDNMLLIIRERHRKYHDKLKSKDIGLAKRFIENPTVDQMIRQIMLKHN